MQSLYAPEATFNDAVFKNLNGIEAGKMWEMLLKNGKDLKLTYKILEETATSGKATWIATYTFSKSGRKVINNIMADFVIKDGKIISHTDSFDFYKWARQAFGTMGLILGWTSFFKNKVRTTAKAAFDKFLAKN